MSAEWSAATAWAYAPYTAKQYRYLLPEGVQQRELKNREAESLAVYLRWPFLFRGAPKESKIRKKDTNHF